MIEVLVMFAILGLLYLYYINHKTPKGRGGPPRGGYSAA